MRVLFNQDYSFSTNGYTTTHAAEGDILEVVQCDRLDTMLDEGICTAEEAEEAEEAEVEDIKEIKEIEEEESDDLTAVYKIGQVGAGELANINVLSYAGLFAFGNTDEGREYLIGMKGITEGNVNRVIDSAKVLSEE